jgi:GAF domain-containing protein
MHWGAAVARVTGDLPIVCIPLRAQEHPVGAILLFKLLEHKEAFNETDDELFKLLARQAATAIRAAQLHAASRRKAATLRGVIDEFISKGADATPTKERHQ